MLPAVFISGALLSVGQTPAISPLPQVEEQQNLPLPPATFTVEVPPPPPTASPPAALPSKPAEPVPGTDRWALMEVFQGTWYGAVLDDNRVKISGWLDITYTGSTDRHDQLPMGFNYLANQYALQQSWLRVEQTVDQNAATPTYGFRSDTILPGADYRFTLARGLFTSQLTADNGNPNVYGIDPVQFYGEYYLPQIGQGLDVKAGRFFAQFGVESIDSTQNAVYSHSYNFVYNPYTNTGLLTTLKLDSAWSVQNGIVTGSDVFFVPEANPTYIGSVRWAPPTDPDSVLFSVILGKGRYDVAHNFSNPEIFDLVYTHKFNDRLNYTMDALYSFQTDFPTIGFVNNWGVAQYLTYQLTPLVSMTGRLEFFDDVQGQRTGYKGLYTDVTTGVTYKPIPSLWLQPELRFDNNAQSRPFEGKSDLLTATMNVIVHW